MELLAQHEAPEISSGNAVAVRTPLYIFGTPGNLGGAATKIRDIIRMLAGHFDIKVVLSHICFTKDKMLTGFLDGLKVPYMLWNQFPARAEGIGLAVCELDFFVSGKARRVKKAGLRLLWSNEMMWKFEGEAQAVAEGLVDRVLFLSEVQQNAFAKLYDGVDQFLIRNHITASDFPYVDRRNESFVIGRLSRPDPLKFPADFPVFYESFGIDDVCYRVQAWDEVLRKKYSWHFFGPEWEFYSANKIAPAKFLGGLDLFVYPLGHKFIESWGRSAVEAMLTGSVPIVPAGHQFHNMIVHGENGFIYKNYAECKSIVRELHRNAPLRRHIGAEAARYSREVTCNDEKHKALWLEALTFD